jgi:hypothetical protein
MVRNIWNLLLSLATLVSHEVLAVSNTLCLQEAGKLQSLRLNISSISGINTHSGKCIKMEFENRGTAELSISIKAGDLLYPADTGTQTMVVTMNSYFVLAPGSKKTQEAYALCSEAHDGAPGSETQFRTGRRSSGELLAMAGFIASKNYQSSAAQNAVWCITDNYSISGISSSDTAEMNSLRRKVSELKKIPIQELMTSNQEETPLGEWSGEYRYEIRRRSTVKIAIYDSLEKELYVLAEQSIQDPGEYRYRYSLRLPLNGRSYPHNIRMYMDGVLAHTRRITAGPVR